MITETIKNEILNMTPSDVIRMQIFINEHIITLKKKLPYFKGIKYAVMHPEKIKENLKNQYLKKKEIDNLNKPQYIIRKCTTEDFIQIETFLLIEKSMFYKNLNIIKESIKDIWVMKHRITSDIIGFCLTRNYTPVILSIVLSKQKNGFGTLFLQFLQQKAIKKNIQYMHINSTESSIGFWTKMGYGNFDTINKKTYSKMLI